MVLEFSGRKGRLNALTNSFSLFADLYLRLESAFGYCNGNIYPDVDGSGCSFFAGQIIQSKMFQTSAALKRPMIMSEFLTIQEEADI